MEFSKRVRRKGETQEEYRSALLALVDQMCALEFPLVPSQTETSVTSSLIGEPSEQQLKPKTAVTSSLIGEPLEQQLKPETAVTSSLIGEPSGQQLKPETAVTSSLIGEPLEQQLKPETAVPSSLIGEPSEQQLKPETKPMCAQTYKKTGGAADGAGEAFECKMLTLVFLRMLAAGHEFQLGSNMEAAGLFDDIVLRYQKQSNDPWRVAYLQLKHKKKGGIPKKELLGLSGAFSLVQYCHSYVSIVNELHPIDEKEFIIFTTAGLNDEFVEMVASNELFTTGGQAVSFKIGGNFFLELCEWVDFKDTLTKLHIQVDGLSDEMVRIKMRDTLEKIEYQNKAVELCQKELLTCSNLAKLKDMIKKLGTVSDKDTYSLFLSKLIVYRNQAKESELDAQIKEEFANVWIRSCSPEAKDMFNGFQDSVKFWWKNDNTYLSQNSFLWLEMIESHTAALSKSTIEGLTQTGAAFQDKCLQNLRDNFTEGGILNLCVDSRTSASSLKVSQALTTFDNVLQVNTKALLEREDDLFAAWATQWCRVLVIECGAELDQEQTARISARVLNVVGKDQTNKLLVLIAPKTHKLNVLLYRSECYTRLNDNVRWNDLKYQTKEKLLAIKVVVNGLESPFTFSEMLGDNKGFTNKADLEVISQLLSGDISCGQDLEEVVQYFVTRRLKKSAFGAPFVVNSVSDVRGKVVLVVGEPGMGKSTLITHLARSAKEEDPTVWVVHIKLNDCVKYLQEIDVEHFTEATAKKFLYQTGVNVGNCLENLLIEYMEEKLMVFIDGVDEVCPYYSEQVFKLLNFLKGMKFCQLWVASRPVFQTMLEVTLEVKALHLVAFSEKDQKEFFNRVWSINVPSTSPEKCNDATENLLTSLSNSLYTENLILGIPMMSSMVAEMFQNRMVSGVGGFKKNERLDILDMYKTFVQKKFDPLSSVKKNTLSSELAMNSNYDASYVKVLHYNHRLAALRVLFTSKDMAELKFEGKEKFDHDLTAYLKDVSDGREKTGLIYNVVDGIPRFVHRSFAEYFAASWMSENFEDNRQFIQRIIFDPKYKVFSDIFHRVLAENHKLHVAILNQDVETTKSILKDKTKPYAVDSQDTGGRTPLHLAMLFNSTVQYPNCIRIMELLLQKHKARHDIADKVLSWTPLLYAEWSKAWPAIHSILEDRLDAVEVSRTPKLDHRLLLDAARDATVQVVRYLVEDRCGKLNYRGLQGKTLVHSAAEGGNIEVLKCLSIWGRPLDVLDKNNNTALRYASLPALKFLLDRGLDLEARNKLGLTAFQDCVQNGAYDVAEALLEMNASFEGKISNRTSKAQRNASLLCAAFAGNLDTVKRLVESGASPGHRDKNGHTPVWVAFHRKHSVVVDWLLQRDVSSIDTLFGDACRTGDIKIVDFSLSRGADINAKEWGGQAPLVSAICGGHLDVVERLLEKGAKMELHDESGQTLLYTSLSRGNKIVTELLLRYGADVNTANKDGETCLHAATASNEVAVVKMLLDMSAKVELKDRNGWTPLRTASSAGNKQLVDLLLRYGADIDSVNQDGETPLHAATANNRSDVVKMLLEKGADVDFRDRNDSTPLYTASLLGNKEIVALLLRYGADVNSVNQFGEFPLHAASSLEVMNLLLQKGASEECRDGSGWTPLHKASLEGDKQVLARLFQLNINVNAVNEDGDTPLHIATTNNKIEVVKFLLEMGANVECRNEDGRTPMLVACLLGFRNIVKVLMDRRADLYVKDNEGRKAIELARTGRNKRLKKDLIMAEFWYPAVTVTSTRIRLPLE